MVLALRFVSLSIGLARQVVLVPEGQRSDAEGDIRAADVLDVGRVIPAGEHLVKVGLDLDTRAADVLDVGGVVPAGEHLVGVGLDLDTRAADVPTLPTSSTSAARMSPSASLRCPSGTSTT